MLEDALQRCNIFKKLPNVGKVEFKSVTRASRALNLGFEKGELEAKAGLAALLCCVAVLPLNFIVQEKIVFLFTIFLPLMVFSFIVLTPLTAFKIKKAVVVQDSIYFLLSFLTFVLHENYETAYEMSIKNIKTKEFREGWVKLKIGELGTIPEVLLDIGEKLRTYSDNLYTVFRTVGSEVQKEKPNYAAVLRESLSAIQLENTIEFNKFADNFKVAATVISFLPLTLFIIVPFFNVFTGGSANVAFIAASIAVIPAVALSIMYMLESYPSSSSFLDASAIDERMIEEFMEVEVRAASLADRAALLAAPLLFLLSFTTPVFLLFLGVLLVWYSHHHSGFERYVEKVKEELVSLPLYLREVSFRLDRDEPIGGALESPLLYARALKHGKVEKLFPEHLFLLTCEVITGLWSSGRKLSSTLQSLKIYVLDVLNYRSVISSQIASVRNNIFLLHLLLPILAIFSVWGFDYLAKSSMSIGSADEFELTRGFSFMNPLNLHLIFGFVNISVFSCMLMFMVLAVLCEDVVARGLLKTKTGSAGIGIIILALGELYLLS